MQTALSPRGDEQAFLGHFVVGIEEQLRDLKKG